MTGIVHDGDVKQLTKENEVNATMKFEATCPKCDTVTVLDLDVEACRQWVVENVKLQDAFANLSATEREVIKSNLCPPCQKRFANRA